ncbi:hypothetical protein Tco_0436963, partial [Tanacetum coccineum]
MIRHRHGKTPYELLHKKPSDLFDLHVLGAMASEHNSSGPAHHETNPATISSRLVVDHPALEVVVLINEVIAPVLADST